MLFSEYVRILQNHFKSSVGDAELCRILFDFVIIPADLRNSKDQDSILTISPGTISKILANSAPVHTQIRDHIYDDVVINDLVKSFSEDIVPELNPENEDLCFQMMEIIKCDNISPSHKAEFELLAKPETIAPFLAKVFIYAVVTNGSNGKQPIDQTILQDSTFTRESALSIKGITKNRRLSDYAIEEVFISRINVSCEKILDRIKSLFIEASDIHLEKKPFSSNPWGIKLTMFEPYSIKKETKELLDSVASSLTVELPDDFYDFGDLYINPIGGVSTLGMPTNSIGGSPLAKQKYKLVDQIEDCINEFLNIAPYFEAFKGIKCISLALSNSGTNYDQDVRITLHFSQESLLLPEEISLFSKDALRYLVEDCDYESQFEIAKGIDYLSYEESENLKPHPVTTPIRNFPFYSQQDDIDYEDEVKNLFGYFYAKDDSGYIVEVSIDNINQHTSVAFPTVILIKETVKEIPYIIKSKQQSQIISGKLLVESLSANDD